MRIAVAGFQHETNTFAPQRAGYHEFLEADAWPGLTRGEAVATDLRGMNLPITGFIERAESAGAELLPILWCSAEPSAYVADEAFDKISGEICQALAEMSGLDALYFDLHGAMVTDSHEDGEGAFLERVRSVVGIDIPIVISLDLHANLTRAMFERTDAMTIFRTYPHLDMARTGARAFELLRPLLDGKLGAKALRKTPFLVPLPDQYTGKEPCKSLYGALPRMAGDGVTSLDLAAGFPPADIHDAGPGLVAYGMDQGAVDRAADELLAQFVDAEETFSSRLLNPDEAVALAVANEDNKPVVLADVQDNPGAGATADTVMLLEALVAGGARLAALAAIHDPEAAERAHAAGPGATIALALGGKSGLPGQYPFEGRFRVERLSDGHFPFTGRMYGGSTAELGPTALLLVETPNAEVRVVVSSKRVQCLDLAIFRHIGVEPEAQRILAVKSTVHYRADFAPIASQVVSVIAPGANPCRVAGIPYKRLRPGVRLGPLGPVHGKP